ncbi:RICIN domain-containing protein [Streptomyces sp. NPDC020379]|uniref:RICIN domain-containing protein n=1 Tax=Streptomyces sp. NPDC020379 TaxID=3365071 RepID=UPI0037A9B3C7
MLKKFRALVVATATVAALGTDMGAAHASTTQPAVNKCQSTHTYETGGMYLEVHAWGGKGAVVDTWEYANQDGHAQDNERWCLEAANQGGWYFHPKYNTNLCLDVPGANYAEGTRLVIWNCNGRENQRFTISNGTTNGYISPVNVSNLGNKYSLNYGGYHGQVYLDWNYYQGNTTYWQ